MAPVEMVAKFNSGIPPIPAKFEYQGKVIVVDQVLQVKEERLAGKRMKVYDCQSTIYGALRRYTIKFELETCIWYLAAI